MGREPFGKLRTGLAVGDTLRRADGGTAKVLAIERVKLDTPQLVYNFTVKGPHTNYVQDIAAPLPQVLTARQGGSVTKYPSTLPLVVRTGLRGLGLIDGITLPGQAH